MFTYSSYGLGVAGVLNVLTHLFTHWSMRFRAFATTASVRDLDDAELVLVVPVKFNGKTELVPLERRAVVGSASWGWWEVGSRGFGATGEGSCTQWQNFSLSTNRPNVIA